LDNVLKSEKNDTEEDNIKVQLDNAVTSRNEDDQDTDNTPDISDEHVTSTSETVKKTGKKKTIKRPKKLNQTIMLEGGAASK
jgi:hypothetical protein